MRAYTEAVAPALVELQSRKQWVCWCLEDNSDRTGKTKIPYQALTGQHASTKNPDTWATYDECMTALRQGRNMFGNAYTGIGFVFNEDYTGIDLDHCRDAEGIIDEWAQEYIDLINGYCEDSPSKTGIHIIVRALLPQSANKDNELERPGKRVKLPGKRDIDAAIEMYCQGRFFTVTGEHITGTSEVIENRQKEVLIAYKKMLQASESAKAKKATSNVQAIPVNLDDAALLDRAFNAANGTDFRNLWNGNISGYNNDHSGADQALCNLLAFWTGKDEARIDRLFRQSGLMREKWDRNARQGETYGEGTISRAIANCNEVYTGRKENNNHTSTNTKVQSNGHLSGEIPKDIGMSIIDKAIADKNIEALFESASVLAQLPVSKYQAKRAEIKEAFGSTISLSALNKEVATFQKGTTPGRKAQNTPKGAIDLCSFEQDDSGNGDAMYALYGTQFLWCGARGWFVYTGTHWETDSEGARVKQLAVETLRQRRHAAVDQEIEGIIKCTKADERRVNGCVSRFKTLVDISIDEFDNNPDQLNCKNGVVDLRTGEIEPHCYLQRFTYCIELERDPTIPVLPEFVEYLNDVVGGGQEVIDFLQMALGYSLTGHTNEECLFYLYGPTRSGKGTLSEIFMKMLPPPLSTGKDFNTFTAKREADNSNFDLAGLKPARMVFASESNEYQSLNPAKIKALTGGDMVDCCFKHKDHFQYRPQYKVWMLSNQPVNGNPDDDALWTRVRVIEFPNSYAGREDKSKKLRLKSPEALQSIFNWAIEGAIKWYQLGARGLVAPGQVVKATNEHRALLDFVQQWLDECCEHSPDTFTTNEQIMASYTAWCELNGVTAKKSKGLTQSLNKKKYQAGVVGKATIKGKPNQSVRGVRGLKIKTIDTPPPTLWDKDTESYGYRSYTSNPVNPQGENTLTKKVDSPVTSVTVTDEETSDDLPVKEPINQPIEPNQPTKQEMCSEDHRPARPATHGYLCKLCYEALEARRNTAKVKAGQIGYKTVSYRGITWGGDAASWERAIAGAKTLAQIEDILVGLNRVIDGASRGRRR